MKHLKLSLNYIVDQFKLSKFMRDQFTLYTIKRRNDQIGKEMRTLIRSNGKLTEAQKIQYTTELNKLKKQLQSLEGYHE